MGRTDNSAKPPTGRELLVMLLGHAIWEEIGDRQGIVIMNSNVAIRTSICFSTETIGVIPED